VAPGRPRQRRVLVDGVEGLGERRVPRDGDRLLVLHARRAAAPLDGERALELDQPLVNSLKQLRERRPAGADRVAGGLERVGRQQGEDAQFIDRRAPAQPLQRRHRPQLDRLGRQHVDQPALARDGIDGLAERLVLYLDADVCLIAPRKLIEHAWRQLDRHAGAVLDLLQRVGQRGLKLNVDGLVERFVDERGTVALAPRGGNQD
jgi:hypothetical protein